MVVIGAGIIGVACALRLQSIGRSVLLIDANEPGRGCSYGNAGIVASSFVLPLSSPRHLLSAPRMLVDPLGPLAIRMRDLSSIAPWLLRFLANARPAAQRRTIEGLTLLNGRSVAAWRNLLADADEAALLVERGMLEVVRQERDVGALRGLAQRLEDAGIPVSLIGPESAGELEPTLAGRLAGALFHERVAHFEDPFGLIGALLAAFLNRGGVVRRVSVQNVRPTLSCVQVETEEEVVEVDKVLLANGFGARTLLQNLGVRTPVGIEFGYHVMFQKQAATLTRPISFHRESFVGTPMRAGLRLAGTVELAAAHSRPDWARADQLTTLALPYLPSLPPKADSRWRGGRPSFPDGLPAIGRLKEAPQIFYAFGHQHLGLTLAAVTGEIICDLVRNVGPASNLFSLEQRGLL